MFKPKNAAYFVLLDNRSYKEYEPIMLSSYLLQYTWFSGESVLLKMWFFFYKKQTCLSRLTTIEGEFEQNFVEDNGAKCMYCHKLFFLKGNKLHM